jgi:hypothetical protein
MCDMETATDRVDPMHSGPVGTVLTDEEYEEGKEVADSTKVTLLVQLGSDACVRCPAFQKEISKLTATYNFRWLYCDAHDADSNRPEHFNITQLPAVVVYDPSSKEHEVVANADAATLRAVVVSRCRPAFTTNADF